MKEGKSFLRRLSKFFKWWVIVIIVILVIARLMLPYMVLKYVNKELQQMKGYVGHVDDIDIWLIRGAYIINDINIWETNTEGKIRDSIPFFRSASIDLSIEWRALFHGRIVGEVEMNNPVLNFKSVKADTTSFQSDTADFRELVRKLMPLTINHFTLSKGQIHFIDLYSTPTVDIFLSDINATATNLSNVLKKDTLLPSRVIANGKTYGGQFHFDMRLDPLNKIPTFDLNAEVVHADITGMNDFLRAYASVDAEGGEFNCYMEFAGRDNNFTGYVKPLIKDLNIKVWKHDENIVNKMWRGLVAGIAFVLKNHHTDQLGTKVSLSGNFYSPKTGIWNAVKYVLINAFINALKPAIDNTVNIQTVGVPEKKVSLLKKIFKKDKGAK